MKYRGCLGFAGLATLAMSLFFVATAFYDLFAGTADNPGVVIGLAVFFGIAALGGGIATYLGFRPTYKKSSDPKEIERTVLGIARDLKGEITIEELALHTPLSVSECKNLLEQMVSDGAAEIGLGPNEETMYVFRGFLVNGKRTRSYDPFSQHEVVLDLGTKADKSSPSEPSAAATHQTEPQEH